MSEKLCALRKIGGGTVTDVYIARDASGVLKVPTSAIKVPDGMDSYKYVHCSVAQLSAGQYNARGTMDVVYTIDEFLALIKASGGLEFNFSSYKSYVSYVDNNTMSYTGQNVCVPMIIFIK